MRDMGIVRGSEAQAQPIVIGLDTVYLHDNIEKITNDDGTSDYQYHEIQYDKSEYLEMVQPEKVTKLETQVAELQTALTKVYSDMGMEPPTIGG